MRTDADHTHKGEHGFVGKRVCVTQDIRSRKCTMGCLKRRKKKKNSYCWGLHNRVEGEWEEPSVSYHWGWRVRVAQCRGGISALCVYWEVPTMKARRLDVLKPFVSVSLHTPHSPLNIRPGRQDPPRCHFRVKSRREAVSQHTRVSPLLLFSAAAFPPGRH